MISMILRISIDNPDFTSFQVLEDVRDLQKKLTQVEGDLVRTKKELETKTTELEEKEKALTNVSYPDVIFTAFFKFLSVLFFQFCLWP